jgi:enoyl-CoA hydratase
MNPASSSATTNKGAVWANGVVDTKFRTLKLERLGSVLVVRIAHPDNRLNFVDVALMEEFACLVAALRTERSARAVVLTGEGPAFSGGGSFELMNQLDRPEFADYICRLAKQLITDMLQIPIPVICAMNGPAIGFGATWVLLSDVVFADEDAKLSDPHVLRGIAAPDAPALWSLAMGPMRAKRFLLTGDELTAAEAVELGLIAFVSKAGRTLDDALAFARRLAGIAPGAVAHTKLLCNKHIRDALELSFDTGAAWESQDFRTNDHKEAIAAFRERRNPMFTGT